MRSLRQLRLSNNLTQTELGMITGLHQVLISNIECGKCKPNDKTRTKLEGFLGPIDWIETSIIKTKSPDYHSAQKLVEQLVATTATMDRAEKKSIVKLLHKYYS